MAEPDEVDDGSVYLPPTVLPFFDSLFGEDGLLGGHRPEAPFRNEFGPLSHRPKEYGGYPVRRGYMITQLNPNGTSQAFDNFVGVDQSEQGRVRLDFMYNPESISFGYQSNGESIKPIDLMTPDELETRLLVDGAYIGFQLVFDRTAEYYAAKSNNIDGDASQLKFLSGSLADVNIFQKLVGYERDGSIVGELVKVVFHPDHLWFNGYITTAEVSHVLFSEIMVPLVSLLSVTVQRQFNTTDASVLPDEYGSPRDYDGNDAAVGSAPLDNITSNVTSTAAALVSAATKFF